MDWRRLLARDLSAMAANADVTVVDNGVKIESNESKHDRTYGDPDYCKYWGIDPWEGWESENSDVEEM